MRYFEVPLFINGDLTQSTLTSAVADCTSMFGFSIQNVVTGNATGNLLVQASNDPVSNVSFANEIVNWTTISTTPITAAGTILINVSDEMWRWTQLVYTKTTGSGITLINSILMGKGV